MAAAAEAAFDVAEQRALDGDSSVVDETAMLLETIPAQLQQLSATAAATRSTSALSSLAPTLRGRARQFEALVRASAAYNAAALEAGAHGLMVRSWRGMIAAVVERRHVARPLSMATLSPEAVSPGWLSAGGGSAGASLEGLLEARVAGLAKEQGEWAGVCAAARQLAQFQQTLRAAAGLLAQQSLALARSSKSKSSSEGRGGSGGSGKGGNGKAPRGRGEGRLAWHVVDRLLDAPGGAEASGPCRRGGA